MNNELCRGRNYLWTFVLTTARISTPQYVFVFIFRILIPVNDGYSPNRLKHKHSINLLRDNSSTLTQACAVNLPSLKLFLKLKWYPIALLFHKIASSYTVTLETSRNQTPSFTQTRLNTACLVHKLRKRTYDTPRESTLPSAFDCK
jgi:hypothetical protein